MTTLVFDDWFSNLDSDGQAEVIAKIELLKLLGPRLGRPHADTLNGSRHANMKELRVSTADQVIRIAFAFNPERTGILLVAGDKGGINSRRFYKQLIAQADRMYELHLAEIRAKRKKEKERG